MNYYEVCYAVVISLCVALGHGENSGDESWRHATSVYQFSVNDINGNVVNLGEKYRGHVLIIVNMACRCGYTVSDYEQLQRLSTELKVCYCRYTASNYEQLQRLYTELKGEQKGLRVLAFLCNQFGGQEPGTGDEIRGFVESLGVRFDMFEEIEVKGKNAHPLYKYLTHTLYPDLTHPVVEWNFSKFLVDSSGRPVQFYSHSVQPLDMREDIMRLLQHKAEL